jgi:hypothetical protein
MEGNSEPVAAVLQCVALQYLALGHGWPIGQG